MSVAGVDIPAGNGSRTESTDAVGAGHWLDIPDIGRW